MPPIERLLSLGELYGKTKNHQAGLRFAPSPEIWCAWVLLTVGVFGAGATVVRVDAP